MKNIIKHFSRLFWGAFTILASLTTLIGVIYLFDNHIKILVGLVFVAASYLLGMRICEEAEEAEDEQPYSQEDIEDMMEKYQKELKALGSRTHPIKE